MYPLAKIYAFEPSGKSFGILSSQIKNSGDNKTSIFQIGIGSSNETLNFYESILDETSTFVLPDPNSNYSKKKNRLLIQKPENSFTPVLANVRTIDSFLRDNYINHVDILKIDVEGFEYQVLLGASETLSAGKIQRIQLERHTDDMRADTFPAIDALLRGFGYSRIKEIKHPFGSFFELLYQIS